MNEDTEKSICKFKNEFEPEDVEGFFVLVFDFTTASLSSLTLSFDFFIKFTMSSVVFFLEVLKHLLPTIIKHLSRLDSNGLR